MKSRNLILIVVVVFVLILGGCGCRGYNSMVNLDEVKGMMKFDADAATETSRPSGSPTAPGVHRAARPAPSTEPTSTVADATDPEGPSDPMATG